LTDSPIEYGYEEPPGDPRNLLGDAGLDSKIENESFWQTFGPIFLSPSFWLLAVIYIGMTFVRYITIDWIPTFMVARAGASATMGSLGSVLPPLAGSVSALMMGVLTDQLSTNWRNVSLLGFEAIMCIATLVQYIETSLTTNNNVYLAVTMFAVVGFALNGPYSIFSAALSVEYGGKKVNATISGLFDGFGMIGAVMSGVLGLIFLDQNDPKKGWDKIFLVVFVSTCAIFVLTVLFCIVDFISKRRKSQSSK
jgi:sugar phosphate permease